MFTKTAIQLKEVAQESNGQQIAKEFVDMLNTWHSLPTIYDHDLERYIHKIEILGLGKLSKRERMNGFTPSSTNSCSRELYHKIRGDKRDKEKIPPHQGRWKEIGTKIGEIIQRDLLYIDKHFERVTGNEPSFTPQFIPDCAPNQFGIGHFPAWEIFAKKQMYIKHQGFDIPIQGQPDGILYYKDRKIGLEIKSKQTSASKTGYFSMRGPEESHVKQVQTYSILYGIDEFIILYVNAAKHSWNPKPEDLQKYPDLRAFYVTVSENDRIKILDKFANILEAVKKNRPPRLDPNKWAFNSFKTAFAKSANADEVRELAEQYETSKQKLDNFVSTDKQKKPPYTLVNEVENYRSILDYVEKHK